MRESKLLEPGEFLNIFGYLIARETGSRPYRIADPCGCPT